MRISSFSLHLISKTREIELPAGLRERCPPPHALCVDGGIVSQWSRRGNQPAVVLNMEDEEVAESWEEAADSGVRNTNRKYPAKQACSLISV